MRLLALRAIRLPTQLCNIRIFVPKPKDRPAEMLNILKHCILQQSVKGLLKKIGNPCVPDGFSLGVTSFIH
jgi:hypothetical protein